MVMPSIAGSAIALAAALTDYAPNHASLSYSDYCAVSVNSSRARFTRPLVDGQGFENANPGARVRFRTNATTILVRLTYNNLVTRLDTYNAQGLVLVDGSAHTTFTRAQGPAGELAFYLTFGSATNRTIELVMPYCAGVDFNGIGTNIGASVTAATARPSTRLVVVGDSITHGFTASGVAASWPYLLANTKTWQLVNHGYGGRVCAASDGTSAANLAPSIATYLIGYNDFTVQTPLATFKNTFKSFINNFRAIAPAVKIYCITPTYSPNTNTLTLANYRTQISDALTELGNALNVLVNGLSLATGDVVHFPDSVHPNDTASAQIATALAGVMSL